MRLKKHFVIILIAFCAAAGYAAARLGVREKIYEIFFPVKSYKEGLRKVLGIDENYPPPSAEIYSTERLTGGVEFTKLYFFPFNRDMKIMAYLFKPADDTEVRGGGYPAVVVFQGHESSLNESALKEEHYEKALPLYLAQNGYVTFIFSINSLEKELGYRSHWAASRMPMLKGGTIISEYLKAGLQAVNYLKSLEYIDGDSIGAAGTSLGGKLAVYTAALDGNIKSVVSAGYMLSYSILTPEDCSCNYIPGIMPNYDFPVTAAVISPRPALYIIGKEDTLSCAKEGANIVNNILSVAYEKDGASQNISLHLHDGGHEMRAAPALEWFDKTLKN